MCYPEKTWRRNSMARETTHYKMATDREPVHEAVSLYRCASWTANLTSACIVGLLPGSDTAEVKVVSTWSQRDLARSKKLSSERTDHCVRQNNTLNHQSQAISRTSNILKKTHSESGIFTAYVVTDKAGGKNADSKEQQYIEIWVNNYCWKVVNPKDFEAHEDIIADAQFGVLSFSPDEKMLLFVAQRKKPKSKSFFETPKKDSKESSSAGKDVKEPASVGEQFLYDQTWGEQFVGITNPVVVVHDIDKNETKVLDTKPYTNISAGQPQWAKHGDGIVFVGWENSPRKHGIVYCTNRRSSLYYHSLSMGATVQLTKEPDTSVYSPRVSPDGMSVVYFSRPADGPHFSCSQLKVLDLHSFESRIIVDIVPSVSSGLGFPGIYSLSMPPHCWSADGNRVYFSSLWRSRQVILCVELDHPNVVHRVSPVDPDGSWTVWDIAEGVIVASFANPSTPTKLLCAVLPEPTGAVIENWTELTHAESSLATDVDWELITLQHDGDDFSKSYEAILYTPKSKELIKYLGVCPHGGPHSAYSLDFYLTPPIMVNLGYAVLLVNYRGSVGFGQELVDGLCGKVGNQDVKDVQHAARFVLENVLKDKVKDRVVVWGGSHGGFLTAHLVGQFPEFYKAACVRNPVTNMAAMTTDTDIPDCLDCYDCLTKCEENEGLSSSNRDYITPQCHVEGGMPYNSSRPNLPSAEMYQKLLHRSPIQHVESVKAPVMLQLGDVDLRVPPSQGLQYYFALQSLGKESKLLMYQDNNHPISNVDAEGDAFVNMMLWFEEYLGTS